MSSKHDISIRQVNSFLLFYAIDNYNAVVTSPLKNRFDIKYNALYNLAVITNAVFKYSDLSDNAKDETKEDFDEILKKLDKVRDFYEPVLEVSELAVIEKQRNYYKMIGQCYFALIDIIIHFKLIEPKSLEQLWEYTDINKENSDSDV